MMNDSYLFLRLDIDPSGPPESPPQHLAALWRRFSRSPIQGEKQNNAHEWRKHTHRHADELCHTQLALFFTAHMEMSAPPRRCRLMSGHVASVDPSHTYTPSSCVWDCRPTLYPPFRVPPSASTPRRETNCECY